MLASRLAWLSATPLGSPVEPEVYWIRPSAALRSGCGGSAALAAAASVSGVLTWASVGTSPASMRASGRTRSKVISTRASQLRRMPAWRRRCSSIWLGRAGGYIGTGTAPANRMPKKQRKKSSPEGSISATQSPGRTPSATSEPAKRVAASCSCPQLSVCTLSSSTRKRTWMRSGWRTTCHSRTSTRVAADSGSRGVASAVLGSGSEGGGGAPPCVLPVCVPGAPPTVRDGGAGVRAACAIARSRSRGVSAPVRTSVGRRSAKRRSMRASSSTRLRLSRPSSRSSVLSRLARRVVPGCSSWTTSSIRRNSASASGGEVWAGGAGIAAKSGCAPLGGSGPWGRGRQCRIRGRPNGRWPW